MTVLIRNIVACTLLFCWYNVAFAQTYGNEWIQYGQKYYSFKIFPPTIPSPGPTHECEDVDNIYSGIQQIDYDALVASAIPITTFSTENIQIFAREEEIPIHIEDGGDSSMDPGDYILFYTERNDGWLDSTLYIDPNDIANPFYSMYNDTLEYFFTWNTSTNNLRYTVENDTNFSSFTAADYVLYDRWRSNSYLYVEGEHVSESTSSFNASIEGWATFKKNGVPGGNSWNAWIGLFDINSVYQGTNAPDVVFDCTIIGASDAAFGGTGNHHVRTTVGQSNYVLNDSIWIGYKGIRLHSEFSPSILPANGDPNFDIYQIDDQNATTDYQSVPFWFFKYPRIPDFDGASKVVFESPNSSIESKIRLDITNVSFNNAIILVHGDVPRKVRVAQNGSFYSALIPNSTNGVDQKVFYQDSSTITPVSILYPVNGNGQFTDFGSIGNLEDALLMVTHPLLDSASTEYVNYRSSAEGGFYNVIRADINELYQQFGGGIPKHINGVRRFAHFMYNNATNKPVGLFLLGKGIKEDNLGGSEGTRRYPIPFSQNLIPSFGYPSSDICITANLEGAYNWAPLIATGRISAQTNTELQDYLNKVKEYEIEQDPFDIYDTPNKDWQKQILHFSGGSDAAQQLQFSGFMDQMKLTIEDSLFGGNVTSVYKATSDPLDPTVLGSVTDRIEQGVSLMNYFGHASATNSGFELNLDDAENWNNQGKYPVMLVNSCYNGNLFSTNISKSEEFVQVPNAGAIGYIASVHLGFDTYLNTYAQELYKQFSRKAYGLTLGEQMKQATEYIESAFTQNLFLEASCTQMLLNGDPMLRLNHHDNPEIELTQQSVSFSPTAFNLTVDSVEMTITLKNLGRSVTDTTILEVKRNFPGTVVDSTYLIPIPELHYTYEYTLKMPLQPSIGIGLNNFTIKIDLPSTVNEQYDEINNNQISKALFIDIDGIVPVEPYDFAVVPEDSVSIIASTINPIADFNTYRFEIDTIDFEGAPSPEHRFALISGFGGVQEVRPSEWILTASPSADGSLQCTDSTVYFWRVSIDGDTTWRETSFQYINGKQGWGQDHFFQFKNNAFTGINYNRPTRDRDFLQGVENSVTCDVFTTTSSPGYYYNAWYFDGDLMGYGICNLTPKLHVVVIDPVTHDPWKTRNTLLGVNLNNDFGNQNDEGDCLPVMTFFTFPQNDPAYLSAFQNMVNTEVPDGYYMLIYTPMTTRYDWWNSIDSVGMYNTFLGLGSDSINGSRPNRPFAFFCKKGDASSVVELYAQNVVDEVHITGSILGDGTGSENTPLIGPADKWNGIYWKQDPEESPSGDTTYLTIEVFDHNMNYQYQIDTLFTLNDSIINLNSTLINAILYPYIRLRATYQDPVTDTPAAIDRWHVLFSPMPEAAIDGSTQYTWTSNDTITEGTEVSFAVDIKNIFTLDMDSLLVNYWIEDQQQYQHIIPYPRQGELLVGDVLRDTITFSTLGLPGLNSLRVEVNPYVNGSLSITDQPEQAHFNNLLQLPFYVRPDSINPILDVTFNGNHILNGDIIDPSSEILITLKDENEFLVMDNVSDTALFGIYITDPAGQLIKIPFVDGSGNTVMQWVPANSQNKRFKIIWPTDFTLDGEYTLLVQGSDKSGNLSGDIEYRVTFEIIHESSITKMMNYPNPFSTSTRFVFTLTGSVEPDDIIIQIMTVSGRVVREITEDQLGHIQIGRNISEYAWDGTDEFGDPLANGVYLYRVKARINGEDIKHRDSGADTYFKKEFGKMYILR